MISDLLAAAPGFVQDWAWQLATAAGTSVSFAGWVWVRPWLGRAARGDRFAVLVCDLADDTRSRDNKTRLQIALKREFRTELQVLPLRRTLVLNPDRGDDLGARAVNREAQVWLRRKRADALIWGSVSKGGDVLSLYFATVGAAADASLAKSFAYEQMEVPASLTDELAQIIGAAAANAAWQAQQGQAKPDKRKRWLTKLDSIANRLRPLIANPKALAGGGRSNVLFAFAQVMEQLGTHRDDRDALETAQRAFEAVVAAPDSAQNPYRLGSAHFHLGSLASLRAGQSYDALQIAWEHFSKSVEQFPVGERAYERALALSNRAVVGVSLELNRVAGEGDRDWLKQAAADYDESIRILEGLALICEEQRRKSEPKARFQLHKLAQQLRTEASLLRSSLGLACVQVAEIRLNAQLMAHGVRDCGNALAQIDRETAPLAWALAQSTLGEALRIQGGNASTTVGLQAAVQAQRDALAIQRGAAAPADVFATMWRLATAITNLARREAGTRRYTEAIEVIDALVKIADKGQASVDLVSALTMRGNAYTDRGERSGSVSDFDDALRDYDSASELLKPQLPLLPQAPEAPAGEASEDTSAPAGAAADLPGQAASAASTIYIQLAAVLMARGRTYMLRGEFRERRTPDERVQCESDFLSAIHDIQTVANFYSPTAEPADWAAAQLNLSCVEWMLGELYNQSGLPEAVVHFEKGSQAARSAMEVYKSDQQPIDWAIANMDLAIGLIREGELKRRAELLEEARAHLVDAESVFRDSETPLEHALMAENWALLEEACHKFNRRPGARAAALEHFKRAENNYAKAGCAFYLKRIRNMAEAFRAAG